MIDEGERAPSFELPAVIEGRPGRVSLDGLLGDSVVVLVFYPADFNPSCTDESTDLDEFDVFRMQSDATILAISGDSVYSHREFARTHDLSLPLLADVRNEVAQAYGVRSEDTRYPNHRAVVVIDHDGQVVYTWIADNIEQRPDIETVQAAFAAVGDADLARTQYREGCDRYDEGRDAFVEGMRAYRRREWVLACSEFETANDALEAAYEDFRRALRFSETDAMAASFERAQHVVEELARAVGLVSDAASAHASRDGKRGKRLRNEAEDVLERVQELGAPPDPDDLPVDIDDDRPTGEGLSELGAVLEGEEDDQDGTDAVDSTTDGTELLADSGSTDETAEPNSPGEDTVDDEDIDEAELEALTAEIETQDASDSTTDNESDGG